MHVAAAAQDSEGRLRNVLVHHPAAPSSAFDLLLLYAARALADAVVTTGANVRLEAPRWHAGLAPDSLPFAGALMHLRQQTHPDDADTLRPPHMLVVSRTGLDLPPQCAASDNVTVVVPAAGGAAAAAPGRPPRAALPRASVGDAVAYAQDVLGARCVSVEAGPSSASGLYRDPRHASCRPTVVLLSLFHGAVASEALGAPWVFPTLSHLQHAGFRACAHLPVDAGWTTTTWER